jgi:hypothetical protein
VASVLSDNASSEDEDDEEDDDDFDSLEMDEDQQIAPVSRLARTDLAREIQAVLPQRHEPFMQSREPEHPEPIAAAAVGGGVVAGAVPAANPSGAIERDPSVNKSLLLRLIAGVRGL